MLFRIRILIKVMGIYDLRSIDPPGLILSLQASIASVHGIHLFKVFEPPKLQNFDLNADPDQAFHCNADPDPASKNNANSCGSGSPILACGFPWSPDLDHSPFFMSKPRVANLIRIRMGLHHFELLSRDLD
jgi:hypothetical protein